MSLETASYIADLVTSNPDGGDQRSTADDHLRLIKAVLKRTFPLLDSAVSLSASVFMRLADVSASVQLQLNQLRDGSATANNALNARFANSASLALTANSASYAAFAGQASSASFATLAATANSASYATLAGQATSASYAAVAGLAANATNATTAASATTAGTATSASSAATLAGASPDTAATASTIAKRDSSGYLNAVYFNQSSADNENPSVGQALVISGADGYFRKSSLDNLGSYLSARNISTKSGINKTLSTAAPSGGSNGDIWYRY